MTTQHILGVQTQLIICVRFVSQCGLQPKKFPKLCNQFLVSPFAKAQHIPVKLIFSLNPPYQSSHSIEWTKLVTNGQRSIITSLSITSKYAFPYWSCISAIFPLWRTTNDNNNVLQPQPRPWAMWPTGKLRLLTFIGSKLSILHYSYIPTTLKHGAGVYKTCRVSLFIWLEILTAHHLQTPPYDLHLLLLQYCFPFHCYSIYSYEIVGSMANHPNFYYQW